jgi:hypothetical protein
MDSRISTYIARGGGEGSALTGGKNSSCRKHYKLVSTRKKGKERGERERERTMMYNYE